MLARLNSPEHVAFLRDFDAAVALDPCWESFGDGSYRMLPGAVHKSPEALVAAYRATHPLHERMADDLIALMNSTAVDNAWNWGELERHLRALRAQFPESTQADFDDVVEMVRMRRARQRDELTDR
jgi:hypothetical protein